MSASSRVRVYLACSLDGFIAGPGDDLSFLHEPGPEASEPPAPSEALGFDAFMSQVGAMLMGRRTHDVIAGMGVWGYGDTPVLVATHREIEPAGDSVRAVTGDIESLITKAKEAAGDKDVYLDGGDLIRQGLDAGLVDELCITFVPILLGGEGIRLFDGLSDRTKLEFVEHHRLGHMLQVTARPTRQVSNPIGQETPVPPRPQ
ncbi:MAG: dihydrofolate reductase family protein [Deltaproteobacteria bacterium]|nr:dihydrofolate reductase family protein [Deltaproteobacteria bacterium]MBW2257844.1 dihydrofolate reductase family protein [Deltaproteobacteria bacterium]